MLQRRFERFVPVSLQSGTPPAGNCTPVRSVFDRSQFRKVTSVKCDPCNVHAGKRQPAKRHDCTRHVPGRGAGKQCRGKCLRQSLRLRSTPYHRYIPPDRRPGQVWLSALSNSVKEAPTPACKAAHGRITTAKINIYPGKPRPSPASARRFAHTGNNSYLWIAFHRTINEKRDTEPF